jgi:hypothetical protein
MNHSILSDQPLLIWMDSTVMSQYALEKVLCQYYWRLCTYWQTKVYDCNMESWPTITD